MKQARVGIIGGSGLYEMDSFKVVGEESVQTPFGPPSDALIFGELDGKAVVFLPRHGRGHKFSPSEINYRANIFAMKAAGVERIFSVSATGSLKESIAPGEFVVVDQFIDRTRSRPYTFFEKGIVAHVGFADPVCPHLFKALCQSTDENKIKNHKGGTYVCIEGPMFSSRAESNVYRSWGADVIGMTNYQEAKLAREAEICYATLALVTDYDCWHQTEEDVDVQIVIRTMQQNVASAKQVLRSAIQKVAEKRTCVCEHALQSAIMTDGKKITEEAKKRLAPIVGRYI